MNIEVLASSSAGNSYKVADLLLDAGLPYKELQKRLNFQVSGISGVLISHSHKDHCKAVPDLLKAGIDCYMSQQTADEGSYKGHRVKVVEPLKQFKIGTWTILPFELEHDVTNQTLHYCKVNGGMLPLLLTSYNYHFPG